jgi:tetratricopeptide (TPR) repeat protein
LLALAAAGREAARAADRPGLQCAWRAAETSAGAPGGDSLAEVAERLLLGDDAEAEASPLVGIAATRPAGDPRSSAAVLVRAAERDAAAGDGVRAEARLRLALERDPASVPTLRALRRALIARGALADAAALCSREADVLKGRDERIRVLLLAAELGRGARPPAGIAAEAPADGVSISAVVSAAVSVGTSGPVSAGSGPTVAAPTGPRGEPARPADPAVTEPLRRILAIDPAHVGAFEQLREALTAAGEQDALGELLAARIAVAKNPFEVAALRLARAELLAGALADVEGAKTELRAILAKEPQHGKALARLADLQYESGAFGEAAELYLKRALAERSPERLREIFLRIGRIYSRHEHDAKRAADAYKRVLQLEGDNREALVALSDLLIEIGETKNAIAVTERLVEQTSEVDKRIPYLIRLGQLWEQAGDLRQAGSRFRRAADDAPRNLLAVGEMVRHFDRTRDIPGRRALLDHALLLLRADLHAGKLDVEVLRALVHVMQWRGRAAAAAAGAQLLAVVSSDAGDRAAVTSWAAPPARGRRLTAIARPDIDERLFPAGLPSGVRNLFRILGEPLAKAVSDLKRYELSRGDKVTRGQGPREIVDAIAAELGVKEVDVYVKPARAASEPAWLAVEPGEPPTLILGASILTLGPHAIRFAAARAVRLCSTHLDLVLRDTPPQTGALVGGIVRQFVTEYRHPDVPSDLMNAGTATVARVLSRRVRQEVMPFAMESAGALDLVALHEAVRDGANQVGLLASGHLPSALSVVLAVAGRTLTLAHLAANPEAMALLDFALSDGYDEICRELEGTGPA